MLDVLEEQLATRLRALGDTTPVELEPPADLEAQVVRERKATRARRYGTAFSIAAALLIVVAIATVFYGRTGEAPVVASPHGDPLPAGTVMLGAKGRYVTARDATGRILATMVTTSRGEVQDAQVTADHRTIFYSVTDGNNCLKIARADIEGRTSSFVARGHTFAVSPDGRRLAYTSWGNPANTECSASGKDVHLAALVVRDLVTGASRISEGANYQDLAFTNDGQLVAQSCTTLAACGTVTIYPEPLVPQATSWTSATRSFAFAGDEMYRVDRSWRTPAEWVFSVADGPTKNARLLAALPDAWSVASLVPAGTDVLFVGTPPGSTIPALYRLVDGRVEKVSDANPGVATPVYPTVVSPSDP